jgi:hypothetical protein
VEVEHFRRGSQSRSVREGLVVAKRTHFAGGGATARGRFRAKDICPGSLKPVVPAIAPGEHHDGDESLQAVYWAALEKLEKDFEIQPAKPGIRASLSGGFAEKARYRPRLYWQFASLKKGFEKILKS